MSMDMEFCYFQKICSKNVGKRLLHAATKTGLDASKITSKKVVHKATEATGIN